MPYARFMPLPELPARSAELDKSMTLVTASPQKDRAIMVRRYLKSKGYKVKYLQDGLLGSAEYLQGVIMPLNFLNH